MTDSMAESVIEDILGADKFILAELLSIDPSDLSIVARQKTLASGRLDLLCLHNNILLLIELKACAFAEDLVAQINGYYEDLRSLQTQRRLIAADIRKLALVTDYSTQDMHTCQREDIELIRYHPESVLSRFYENFKELASFLTIRSGDFGVVRLGLLKSNLRLLSTGRAVGEISALDGRSDKTVRNRLSVARLLGLVAKPEHEYYLTDAGNSFLEADAADCLPDRLSDSQGRLLARFVSENPFFSSITYSILSLVEAVFVLSKSAYPVPQDLLREYFVKSVGKTATWKTDKARQTATYIFANYACELLFLARVGGGFYLTPMGIRAVLLLQLSRSIRIIQSQR